MKNRRDFLKIFGSTLAVGALALIMGAAGKAMPVATVQGCVKNPRKRVRGFLGVNPEGKWIGRKEDTFKLWAVTWETMAFKSGYMATR